MCRFKSGLILKNRVVVAQADNDSHSDLLEGLKIDDTEVNAMTKFVRAELIPPNNEWWTDPSEWEFHIDQDIRPDWFNEDVEKYEDEFRKAVKGWWNTHVLVDKKVEELKEGYYRLKRCEVKKILNNVKVVLDNSTVQKMLGNSTVQEMWGNSTVQDMWGNSIARDTKNKTILIAEKSTYEVKRKGGK